MAERTGTEPGGLGIASVVRARDRAEFTPFRVVSRNQEILELTPMDVVSRIRVCRSSTATGSGCTDYSTLWVDARRSRYGGCIDY